MDFFNPATHTCRHCERVILDGTRLMHASDNVSFDLETTCDEAMSAARSGCQFFQHILHPVWPDSKDIVPQLRFSFRREAGKRTRVVVCVDFVSKEYQPRAGDRTVALAKAGAVPWLSDWDSRQLHSWTRAIFAAYVAPENWEYKHLDHFELPPNLNVISPRAMSVARSWLSDCVVGHRRCAGEESYQLPSRLLEVGSNDIVRVVTPSNPVPYICLSYCWGGDQQVKSTRSNIATHHMPGLRISTLSKSIRDGIHVTMILGLRYIWIDALCIVQDDPADTAGEIAKMPAIYQGALLTLSAGGASSSSDGFLGIRDPSTMFKIKVRGPKRNVYEMLLDPLSPILSGKQPADPLNTRAWTLQETLLSRRILYFSPNQLIWKCVECELSDGGYIENTFPMRTQWYKLETVSDRDRHLRMSNMSMATDQTRSVRWWQIVEEYSSRAMTSGSDKLVAIAAVAETFQRLIPIQERRKWRYLAGLWEQTLLRDLVWSPEHSGTLPARPPYRAPSWSWASVDCHVTVVAAPASFQKGPNLIVNDVHVEPRSWDARFGAIVEARLTVTGMTKDLGDCRITAGGITMSFRDPVTEYAGSLGLDASEPQTQTGSIVRVTLLQVESFKGSADNYEMILVLRSTGRPNEYRRVGSFFPSRIDMPRWSEWDASFTRQTIEII